MPAAHRPNPSRGQHGPTAGNDAPACKISTKYRPFPDVPEERRRNMAAIKGKNTKPEILVRRMLHRQGYRFRLHQRNLPGHPDIVFMSRRKIIEVMGCFWHQHQEINCRKSIIPLRRREYWEPKLRANVERDAKNMASLRAAGWEVLAIWECEVHNTMRILGKMQAFLGPPARVS